MDRERLDIYPRAVSSVLALSAICASTLDAQTLRGRIVDETNGQPVPTAGVSVLDLDQRNLASALADSLGRYVLVVPGPGQYRLLVERLGYSDFLTPVLEVGSAEEYEVDLPLVPEPFTMDGLDISVRNETLEDWFRLRILGSPYARSGFRVLQGQVLEEAKSKSDDNTELFRWLFIPISHGRRVCLFMPTDGCGDLYVDNFWRPNELIEHMDLASIQTVVVFRRPPEVWIFTKDFDWERSPLRGSDPPGIRR